MTELNDTYVHEDGSPLPQVSDLPGAKQYLCFNTKSGDFVRLQFTGSTGFILTKEFLEIVAPSEVPVPGFPMINGQYKSIWVQVDYIPPDFKEENIVRLKSWPDFDPDNPEPSWKDIEAMARKAGWIG